jgi:hypothetical protein
MTYLIDNTVIKYKFWQEIFWQEIFWREIFWREIFWREKFWQEIFWQEYFGGKYFGGKAVNRIYIIWHLGNSCDSQSKKVENPLFGGALFILGN